jgi:SSS family solute:Na+ symporter
LKFDWAHVTAALSVAPADASLLNPFKTGAARDFNIWFYLISAFGTFYTLYAWQGCQGYQVSAINAHESMMSKMLQTAKTQIQSLQLIIIPVAAYTFLHHQDFTAASQQASAVLGGIDNEMVRGQMAVPVALRFILPIGLVGCMCAIMFSAFVSNHDIYLLSWGSVFVQDVILPYRNKPIDAKQHLTFLRWSVFGVAVFIYCFSLFFRQTQHIYMFFAITAAIWLGGAGSVIVGGLYWKRGTTAAAYASLITGSILAVAGIVLEQFWPRYHDGASFFINGQWMWFIAMVSSIAVYIIVSLTGRRSSYDLDKLLHRGKYAVQEYGVPAPRAKTAKGIKAFLGMSDECTRRDVVTYWFCLATTALLVVLFVLGTLYSLFVGATNEQWAKFWQYFMFLMMVLGVIVAVWISVGGLREMPEFFKRLRDSNRDDTDDGTVKTQVKTDPQALVSDQK